MKKPETISFYRRRLPHWTVRDGLYFVTIRQKDSIPTDAALKIRGKILELEKYSETEQVLLKRKIFAEMEKWLDRRDSKGILTLGGIPQIVSDTLKHKHSTGDWRLLEYVVMPNHVHFFVEILKGTLKKQIESFKKWTGHKIVQELNSKTTLYSTYIEYLDSKKVCPSFRDGQIKYGVFSENASGEPVSERLAYSGVERGRIQFWHREWFDHWSRTGEQDERIRKYIRNNPVKAGMVKICSDWPFGSGSTPPRSSETGMEHDVLLV